MPKFRTPRKDRTAYIYRDASGRKVIELKPGENDVTEALIAKLHAEDDSVHNAEKRDSYYGTVHIQQAGVDGDYGIENTRHQIHQLTACGNDSITLSQKLTDI